MDYEKKIDIPFGAHDSELKYWEYTIPEGFTAEIKGGKVIVREKASEDEKVRKAIVGLIEELQRSDEYFAGVKLTDMLAYLEKQKINTEGDFGRGYDCGYEACLNSHGAEWFEKQKNFAADEYWRGFKNGRDEVTENPDRFNLQEKQKEQKPLNASGTAEPDYGICDDYIPAALHIAMARHGWYACHVGEKEEVVLERKKYVERNWTADKDNLTQKQKDYNKLYEDIAKSEWFKKAYEGKSLGCDYEQKEPTITANDLDEEIHRFFDDCIDVHEAKLYGSISERVIPVDCYELTARHFAKWGERQKENPKSADSIPPDCMSDVKCEDRWHKTANSLPYNGRDVLAKDALGNYLLASFDGAQWFVSVYDGEDHPVLHTPPILEWCDIPSEKQKEQKPVHTAKEMWKEMRLEVYAQASGNRHEPNYSDDSTKMFSLCDIDEIFDKIGDSTVGLQSAEWSEDYREEDIQTRFAFYTYKDDPSTLYLSNVFVEEASRNRGFGTRILRAAEKVAETIGATTIRLKVKQDSPANVWYRKNGYGYVAFEDCYDWLEKNLEYMKPNNQEWSEEDRNITEELYEYFRYLQLTSDKEFSPSLSIDEILDWLKSLHPSWKPSEEQISSLKQARDYYMSGRIKYVGRHLSEIAEQLEKLM